MECESLCNIIKSLYNTKETIKEKYINKLLTLSQVGLVSKPAHTRIAQYALQTLKDEILLIEGKRIKNKYMKILGVYALVLAVIFIIVMCFSSYNWLDCICLAIVGSVIGTWVSFGARKFVIELEDLSTVEKDKMDPLIRLVYISISTVIFMLFLNIGLIEIKFGELETSMLFEDKESALIIGIICGLIESKIGVNIYKHAISVFESD
ncbi:MAG: hypothetical protein Q4D76_17220 [Oscillospiraceae bacterium]|nr:hypothetical protein [Oscillospiraceae bacterium]